MLRNDLLVKTLLVANALLSLYSFDIFGELALRLTSPPHRQIAFEDVVDLFQSASSSLRIREEDVESHSRAQDAEDDVCFPVRIWSAHLLRHQIDLHFLDSYH